MTTTQHIRDLETQLLDAFQKADLPRLDAMIHDQAMFVLPNGMLATKEQVMANYRSGTTAMTSLVASELQIHETCHTAVVSFILQMKGSSLGQTIHASFRYSRVWIYDEISWKVISTCGVAL